MKLSQIPQLTVLFRAFLQKAPQVALKETSTVKEIKYNYKAGLYKRFKGSKKNTMYYKTYKSLVLQTKRPAKKIGRDPNLIISGPGSIKISCQVAKKRTKMQENLILTYLYNQL